MDLKGLSPTEARLFTLEARLRTEENRRIQAIEELLVQIAELHKAGFRKRSRGSAMEPGTKELTDIGSTPRPARSIDLRIGSASSPRKQRKPPKWLPIALPSSANQTATISVFPLQTVALSPRDSLELGLESGRSVSQSRRMDYSPKPLVLQSLKRHRIRPLSQSVVESPLCVSVLQQTEDAESPY